MKLSILVSTTFVSSVIAFLPALFSLENVLKTLHTTDDRLNIVCQKLADTSKPTHNVSDLHGSWRQLHPKQHGCTTYQLINYEKRFALSTTFFSNGTRVESIMPFDTCGRDEKIFFTHARTFTIFGDDSRFASNATCSAQSFELVYASTSIRVDRMVPNGAFRVFVPCDNVFVNDCQ